MFSFFVRSLFRFERFFSRPSKRQIVKWNVPFSDFHYIDSLLIPQYPNCPIFSGSSCAGFPFFPVQYPVSTGGYLARVLWLCYNFLDLRKRGALLMPTMKDVAKLAGVSHGTVSNVINGVKTVNRVPLHGWNKP